MRQVHLHYFSGTGNTEFVVGKLSRVFQKMKVKTVVSNMEQGVASGFSREALHLFLFPVLGFSAPDIALKYIRSLPVLKDARAAILFTGAGYAGYAHVQAERELKGRGIRMCSHFLLECPINWTQMVNPMPPGKAKILLEKAEKQLPLLAKRILAEEAVKADTGDFKGFLSMLVSFAFSKLGRFVLGTSFVSDKRCNACGLCVRSCPSRNISFKKIFSRELYWGWKCLGCNRCINVCPRSAIQVSWLILALHSLFQVAVVIGLVKFFLLADPGLGLLAGRFAIAVNIFGFISALALAILFEVSAFNGIIFFLHQIPAIRSLSALSWTRGFRRYVAPGFKPALSALRPSQGKR
jgi:Pyruvate/2-oxoacid:ferredoxin oxidoreductase delta subunit